MCMSPLKQRLWRLAFRFSFGLRRRRPTHGHVGGCVFLRGGRSQWMAGSCNAGLGYNAHHDAAGRGGWRHAGLGRDPRSFNPPMRETLPMKIDASVPLCGVCDERLVKGVVRPKMLAHIRVTVHASIPGHGCTLPICSWACLRTWAAEMQGGGLGEPIQRPRPPEPSPG